MTSQKSSPDSSNKMKRKYSDDDLGSASPKRSLSETFNFENFKLQLNKFLQNEKLNLNEREFWLFLRKYEQMKKGKSVKDTNRLSTICFGTNLTCEDVEKYLHRNDKKEFTNERIEEFLSIVIIYLDFKQKQKFKRLEKLRKSQEELPVAMFSSQIIDAVKNEKVVIVAGDTGCGKSTQVPQYLLKAGFKKIACTQPRRIACISLAKRLAFETLSEHTCKVGYQIRFEKEKNSETQILFITEGLLLRQISSDSNLPDYDIIVLDEVHERHLSGDFLLGVLKCLLYKKHDMKVVLMSATININLFSDYFGGNAKVIQVPGRLHPVKLFYRPISSCDQMKTMFKSKQKSPKIDPEPYLQIIKYIDNKYPTTEKGDVLIFLSGISDITTVIDAIKEYNLRQKSWIVLPLHSSLSLKEQDKVFDYAPDGVRKCIVSTNIAETSITIDGIRFVIDSGKVKEMCYDVTQKLQKLKEFWVSAASAEQRKGRAGRTGPGVCFRIYSEEEYSNFLPYSVPEIQRVSIDSLLLQMISMGLPNCRKFPFLEPPDRKSLESSILSLKQQSTLTNTEKLTPLGRALANLPIDITLGKILILGSIFEETSTIIPLAASLSVQSPFTNRAFQDECERKWKEFESDQGDPITLLFIYREWLRMKKKTMDSRYWCFMRGLEEQRLYEIVKLSAQFKDLLKDSDLLNLPETKPQTKFERSLRHGEVKLLKSLRRDYSEEKKSAGRKTLKLDVWELNTNEEKERIDIRDVEFRLLNDRNKIDEWLTKLNIEKHKMLSIIKVIFCWGLYPQFAIKDEFNDQKSSGEQFYHARDKPYVSLHPNNCFINNSDILKISESDVVIPKNNIKYECKIPFSSRHQILCYLNMLETNKTYLIQTLRMPALQTFLLYSQAIDTNNDLSRIICDNWVLFEILDTLGAEGLLLKVVNLRKRLDRLIHFKLSRSLEMEEQLEEENIEKLIDEIISFQNIDIIYSMKRLLPADLKTLMVPKGDNFDFCPQNPFDKDFPVIKNEIRGGMKMCEYLTYNSVTPCSNIDMLEFECPKCKLELELSCIDRLVHKSSCNKSEKTNVESKICKNYYCDKCSESFNFNSIQILKHKKHHS